ncbi:MAG: dTMP kinase [Candidatus Methanoliparum thermophilum]|uniref:Probable thymidylate kinase n=1 Tax=Methanoliparum thermophilum TaxID=2491083 RepID=A0A520KQU2_METT2|nr:MAG: dTMP kinase [Candidatus Methanoliparum thermophilum]
MRDNTEINGRLIVVEGLDGSGKSTQVSLLRKWLESQDVKVSFTVWNSSDLVKKATRRGKKKQMFTPTTFSLLHCTDFADRYEQMILPQLKAGYIVLADRYAYTAFARDVVRGCDREWVRKIYNFAIEPHISFFFRLPLEVALGRVMIGRSMIKFYEAGMDMGFSVDPKESFRIFQDKISEEYERIIKEFNFEVIDATRPIKEQQDNIREIVSKKIDLYDFKYKSLNIVKFDRRGIL